MFLSLALRLEYETKFKYVNDNLEITRWENKSVSPAIHFEMKIKYGGEPYILNIRSFYKGIIKAEPGIFGSHRERNLDIVCNNLFYFFPNKKPFINSESAKKETIEMANTFLSACHGVEVFKNYRGKSWK